MNPKQKMTAAAAVGLLVLMTGSYALYASERNGDNQLEVSDTSPLSESRTSLHRTDAVSATTTQPAPSSPTSSVSSLEMIPAGTTVDVKIHNQVSSRNAKVGDRVTGATINDVVIDGRTLIPAGSTVVGAVSAVRPASQTKAAAVLKFTFTEIANHATHLAMVLPDLEARARAANHAVDAGLVVGGAAAGAVIGNQTNSRNGSVIGGVVGGVAGGVVAANIGANVQLKAGETAKLRFTENLSL